MRGKTRYLESCCHSPQGAAGCKCCFHPSIGKSIQQPFRIFNLSEPRLIFLEKAGFYPVDKVVRAGLTETFRDMSANILDGNPQKPVTNIINRNAINSEVAHF